MKKLVKDDRDKLRNIVKNDDRIDTNYFKFREEVKEMTEKKNNRGKK